MDITILNLWHNILAQGISGAGKTALLSLNPSNGRCGLNIHTCSLLPSPSPSTHTEGRGGQWTKGTCSWGLMLWPQGVKGGQAVPLCATSQVLPNLLSCPDSRQMTGNCWFSVQTTKQQSTKIYKHLKKHQSHYVAVFPPPSARNKYTQTQKLLQLMKSLHYISFCLVPTFFKVFSANYIGPGIIQEITDTRGFMDKLLTSG